MSIEALVEAIDELIAEDALAHCDAASVKCLMRQLTRLESVTTNAVAAFDSSGDWSIDGAKTAAAWVSTACRLPRAMGRRRGVAAGTVRWPTGSAGTCRR